MWVRPRLHVTRKEESSRRTHRCEGGGVGLACGGGEESQGSSKKCPPQTSHEVPCLLAC